MSRKKISEKKGRLSKRFILFFFILTAVCLFVLYATQTGGISLSNVISTIGSGISGNAEGTSISFDSNDSNRFHLSKNGLFVLAPDGLRVYDMSGKEKNFTPLAYRNPSVSASSRVSAIFDRGSTSFFITDGNKVLLDAKAPAPIISMNMNRTGAFSLITSGPDCKSLVTVYSSNCKEIYKLYSTDEYVASAAISTDCKKMVTLSFSAKEGQFEGKLFFYRLDEESPYNTITLPDVMPLDAAFNDTDDLTVICEDRFIRYSSSGEVKEEIPFNSAMLMFTATGSHKFSAFILDKRNTDGFFELISSQRNTDKYSSIQFSEEVLSLSSAGNYLAVQFFDRVTVYKSDLTEFHSFEIPPGTRSTLVREDGSVLLIGINQANLLVP